MRVPAGRGLSGGPPGAATANVILRDTDISALFASGRMPSSTTRSPPPPPRCSCRRCWRRSPRATSCWGQSSGAGYGDPLRREPARVARDVGDGLVSFEFALAVYGVVLGSDGTVDARATAREREVVGGRRVQGGEPALIRLQVVLGQLAADRELEHRQPPRDQVPDSLLTLLQPQITRVQAVWLDRDERLGDEVLLEVERTQRGALPGGVTVEGEDDLSAELVGVHQQPAKDPDVPVPERGTRRRHRGAHPGQVAGHDVGVPLDDDRLAALRDLAFGQLCRYSTVLLWNRGDSGVFRYFGPSSSGLSLRAPNAITSRARCLPKHRPNLVLHAQEYTEHISVEDGLISFGGYIGSGAGIAHCASIIDGDVQATETSNGPFSIRFLTSSS